MTILAIETTAAVASAAIWRDGAVAASLHADAGLRHAETVLPLIQRLLQEQETALEEVDAFAVDIGPGSFTGVRIGVCIANGLAYAGKKRVIGVNALQALCEPCSETGRPVCALIDARNGNAYAAVYQGGQNIVAPCAVETEAFLAGVPAGALFVGDAVAERLGIAAALRYPEAAAVAALAARNPASACDSVTPLYLRPSQAERLRREAGK